MNFLLWKNSMYGVEQDLFLSSFSLFFHFNYLLINHEKATLVILVLPAIANLTIYYLQANIDPMIIINFISQNITTWQKKILQSFLPDF